jgi:ferritin-like metal-binding protein YciE
MNAMPQSSQEKFASALKEIQSAERQIAQAMPQLAKAANDLGLQAELEKGQTEAQTHLERLDLIFESLSKPARARRGNSVVRDLIAAAREWTQLISSPTLRDAGLAVIAQKIEHYKIALYGAARALANELRRPDDEALLEVTLEEEKEVDHALAVLAPALGTVPGRASFEYRSAGPRGSRRRPTRIAPRLPKIMTLLAVAPA